MIRKKNRYLRPKKAFEIARIKEENALLNKYGLKNKLEVWKGLAKVNYFRSRAKALAKSSSEEQNLFFDKLKVLGLDVNSISDVLALKIENLLERRLPTIVAKKGLAKTAKGARQMVTHKRILVDGKIINIPSYLVTVREENLITLKKTKAPAKKAEPVKSEEAVETAEESQQETGAKA